MASRRVVKGVLGPTIADGTFLQTTAIGLDHRDMLPPFQPMFRGEDVVFPVMLRAMRPETCIAYLPWTVLHEPMESRGFPDEPLIRAAERAAFFQLVYLNLWATSPRCPCARPRTFGRSRASA